MSSTIACVLLIGQLQSVVDWQTLLSVALGAAIPVAIQLVQWRRESRYRWVEQRQEAFAEFLAAIRDSVAQAKASSYSKEESFKEWYWQRRNTTAFNLQIIRLLGREKSVQIANQLAAETERIVGDTYGRADLSTSEIERRESSVAQLSQELISAARDELVVR